MGTRTNISDGRIKLEKDTGNKNIKKKIIPVVSDSSESSASPEESSSPIESLTLFSRFRNSKKKMLNQKDVKHMRGRLSNSLS